MKWLEKKGTATRGLAARRRSTAVERKLWQDVWGKEREWGEGEVELGRGERNFARASRGRKKRRLGKASTEG